MGINIMYKYRLKIQSYDKTWRKGKEGNGGTGNACEYNVRIISTAKE